MDLGLLLSSLAALPLETATRICLDFVQLLIANNPAFRHQLECILNPPTSTVLPALDTVWEEEVTRRQAQDDSLVPELILASSGFDISKSLRLLRPRGALDDEIINEYLGLVRKEAPQNVFITTTYLPRRPDFNKILKVIIPIHHPHLHPHKMHWTLAILERECLKDCFRLVLFDSLRRAPKMPHCLKLWLADLDFSKESTGTPNPQQSFLSNDCGLFLLLGARLSASGKPMPTQEGARYLMDSFRRRVLAEILAGKLDPTIADYEGFRKSEKERQAAALTLMELDSIVRKPPPIVLNHGKEVIDLISPATIISGDLTSAATNLNSNDPATWEPPTIDPKVILYQPHTPAEISHAVELSVHQIPLDPITGGNMFVNSPELNRESVPSPESTLPNLPTPAPSCPDSPLREGSPVTGASPEPDTPQSADFSSPSSTKFSPESFLSRVSSDENTTISRESLPKLGKSAHCWKSPAFSARRTTKLCELPSVATNQRRPEMSPVGFQTMRAPIALEGLNELPSILKTALAESKQGVLTISLPKTVSESQLHINITHPTLVQSIAFQNETIFIESEYVKKQTAITLPQPGPHMDIDPNNLEKLALSFEENIQSRAVTQVEYVAGVPVTSLDMREKLTLPSSKISNPPGNALLLTPGRFEGIHRPMAYLSGGYGTCFSAHIEDYGLCSINYLWYGAPRLWVIIPPSQKSKFELLVRDLTKTRKKCSQFVRHEGIYLPLDIMRRASLDYQIIIQRPGELVFTFADTYHQGFNLGPNLAESINYATDLRTIASYIPCTSICPGGERIPQSGMLHLGVVTIKRHNPESPVKGRAFKKPRTTIDVLTSFANLSSMAHSLQHAIAAKRRSAQKTDANQNLLGLWRIVNTNGSLQTLESRYFRERFAREWMTQWESQPKRSAGEFMKEKHGFKDCFVSAQKAANRAKVWVRLCDIFKDDLGDDCIVTLCAVAETTSTIEQLGVSEIKDFLKRVVDQKQRVLSALKAVVPAFQYILGLRPNLSTLLIEELDLGGDVIVKELSDLSVDKFQKYFKASS